MQFNYTNYIPKKHESASGLYANNTTGLCNDNTSKTLGSIDTMVQKWRIHINEEKAKYKKKKGNSNVNIGMNK